MSPASPKPGSGFSRVPDRTMAAEDPEIVRFDSRLSSGLSASRSLKVLNSNLCSHPGLCITARVSRYTPTCVGKTYCHTCQRTIQSGTPPRVWGKRGITWQKPRRRRYTPTCVGKTCHPHSETSDTPVHPHVCGENALMVLPNGDLYSVHPHVCGENASVSGRSRNKYGTPPRVWGKPIPSAPARSS